MARWHEKLQDYNFKILHMPRKNNMPADTHSRPRNDEWEVKDKQLPLILPETFLNIADTDSTDSLEILLCNKQQQYVPWVTTEGKAHLEQGLWRGANHKLAVSPDQELQRQIMHTYHNGLTAHPGCDEMMRKVLK